MSEVEYREVPGFPGYRVGNDGSVWSGKKKGNWLNKASGVWREMKTMKHKRGEYLLVTLSHEGKLTTFLLHRLVLLCFVGPPPTEDHLGLHRNDDKTNNTPENLYWGTHAENMQDAMRNGHVTKGTKNGRVKLTEEQVKEIKRLRAVEGIGCRRLAKIYGVKHSTIQYILDGTNWSHVESEHENQFTQGDTVRGERNAAAKITEEQVREIKRIHKDHPYFSQEFIASKFGIHQTVISAILCGKTWQHVQ